MVVGVLGGIGCCDGWRVGGYWMPWWVVCWRIFDVVVGVLEDILCPGVRVALVSAVWWVVLVSALC